MKDVLARRVISDVCVVAPASNWNASEEVMQTDGCWMPDEQCIVPWLTCMSSVSAPCGAGLRTPVIHSFIHSFIHSCHSLLSLEPPSVEGVISSLFTRGPAGG